MTYPRKQVNDILVGLLRLQGVAEDKLQAQAAVKLDEAVARATRLAKSAQDISGWQAAVIDLRDWLKVDPAAVAKATKAAKPAAAKRA